MMGYTLSSACSRRCHGEPDGIVVKESGQPERARVWQPYILAAVFGCAFALVVSLCLPTRSNLYTHISSLPSADVLRVSWPSAVELAWSVGKEVSLVDENKVLTRETAKAEAQEALKAAQRLKDDPAKEARVRKLLRHAMALDPRHADILTAYGEFVEREDRDPIAANHLYTRALVASPGHERALASQRRTAGRVREHDALLFRRIDAKRDRLVRVPESHGGLRRLKKEMYFRHVYHTVAIEGNTLTLAQTRSIIETRLSVGGKSVMEHNEVLGMDAALSYVNGTLLNRIGRIAVDDLLEMHRRVLGFVDPLEAGRLRATQVYVGSYAPPPARDVGRLLADFVDWLNSDEALQLHPIELAAIAHYRLVAIHPFYDGNGRTSRLLMNLVLMNAGYPPVVVRVQERLTYYEHLEAANGGDVRPFVRFVAACAERTVDEYLAATAANPELVFDLLSRDDADERIVVAAAADDDADANDTSADGSGGGAYVAAAAAAADVGRDIIKAAGVASSSRSAAADSDAAEQSEPSQPPPPLLGSAAAGTAATAADGST